MTAPDLLNPEPPSGRDPVSDAEVARSTSVDNRDEHNVSERSGAATGNGDSTSETQVNASQSLSCLPTGESSRQLTNEETDTSSTLISRTIQFGDNMVERGQSSKALYIPPPWKRDRGEFRHVTF